METDYQPGDFPVPVGARVYYEDGPYIVEGWHKNFEDHPTFQEHEEVMADIEEIYPDGVAYTLFPADIQERLRNKMGMRHHRVDWVRRTSFRVIGEGGKA